MNKSNTSLYIVRGLPGSGKSTLAKMMLEKKIADAHFEADDYLMKDGVYQHDFGKLRQVHARCLWDSMCAVKDGRVVVVANTFLRWRDFYPYFLCAYMAGLYSGDICIVEATGNYPNVHGVPDDRLQEMKAHHRPIEKLVKDHMDVFGFRFNGEYIKGEQL